MPDKRPYSETSAARYIANKITRIEFKLNNINDADIIDIFNTCENRCEKLREIVRDWETRNK